MSKMKNRGRPKREFAEAEIRLVESLAGMGCTYDEIAGVLRCSVDTVRDRINDETTAFSDAHKKGKADLKISLRRAQIRLARKGNAAMLIWLGKSILGQRDNEMTNEATRPIIVIPDRHTR